MARRPCVLLSELYVGPGALKHSLDLVGGRGEKPPPGLPKTFRRLAQWEVPIVMWCLDTHVECLVSLCQFEAERQ